MRIGYPAINTAINCTTNSTFRLKSYSESRFIETVTRNLDCLQRILNYNKKHGLLFFRIGSNLIPFASHPICQIDWVTLFEKQFTAIGELVSINNMRISMHPDQFIVINSPNKNVVERSIAELHYHAKLLDAMGLDQTAKIQIHVGGIYNNKEQAIERFISRFLQLEQRIRDRLVIENDHRLFGVEDCVVIANQTSIPMVFDNLHHAVNNVGDTEEAALDLAVATWMSHDGQPIVDYSDQDMNSSRLKHALTINISAFKKFIQRHNNYDFDIMLEIKDKQQSAFSALKVLRQLNDSRLL